MKTYSTVMVMTMAMAMASLTACSGEIVDGPDDSTEIGSWGPNKSGYVFSRTDSDELRWITRNSDGEMGSIWIDQACADSLHAKTLSGTWADLIARAPAHDSVEYPCHKTDNQALVDALVDALAEPEQGFVFSRTDTSELRWITTNSDGEMGSIWIDQACAVSLGGPWQTGDWAALIALAPAHDSVEYPCSAGSDGNGSAGSDGNGSAGSDGSNGNLNCIANSGNIGCANPAVVDCEAKGYEVVVAQIGLQSIYYCQNSASNKRCPVWQFYRNECGL